MAMTRAEAERRVIEAARQLFTGGSRYLAIEHLLRQIAALDALPDTGEADAVLRFAEAILHGDERHRQWLRDAAAAFVAGQPVPIPTPPNTGEG